MERWTWPFVLQQAFMGAAWTTVRELFAGKGALADGLGKEKTEQ